MAEAAIAAGSVFLRFELPFSAMKNLLRFIAFVLMVGGAYAQSNLPACRGSDVSKWNKCVGTAAFTSGNKYAGDYKASATVTVFTPSRMVIDTLVSSRTTSATGKVH